MFRIFCILIFTLLCYFGFAGDAALPEWGNTLADFIFLLEDMPYIGLIVAKVIKPLGTIALVLTFISVVIEKARDLVAIIFPKFNFAPILAFNRFLDNILLPILNLLSTRNASDKQKEKLGLKVKQ